MKKPLKVLTQRIRDAVDADGRTQGEIAEAARMSQGTLSNILAGSGPSVSSLLKLCEALELRPEQLLRDVKA